MVDLLGLADPVSDDELVCSGKGCRADAAWGLLWNTPKIHTPASLASYTTLCEASDTAGRSSSGMIIVPSSNEIRYRVTSWLLVPASSGRLVRDVDIFHAVPRAHYASFS